MKKYISKYIIVITLAIFFGNGGDLYAASVKTIEPVKTPMTKEELLATVQGQLDAIAAHDTSKAYYAFTTRGFRSSTSREGFQRFVYDNPVLSKNQSALFNDPQMQSGNAIFQGTFTSTDGDTKIVEYALQLEENQWKILGMKIYPLQKK